ncbi:MAG: hypothetical protein ABUL44_03740, partial [Flavobacterium sp.]
MKITCTYLIASLILCLIGLSSVKAQKRMVKETKLTSFNPSLVMNNSYSFSNNMKRIAYCMRMGKKQVVVVESLKGNPYDQVGAPVFSPDGNSFAY